MAGTIIVAWGANLTPPGVTTSQAFDGVVKALESRGLRIVRASRLWRSQAWPNPDDPPYHNAVLIVESDLAPEAVMALLHEVEAEGGRRREAGVVNAPRSLDLDLIAYGDVVRQGALTLPHPRAHERGFVMGPLAEIAPDWVHPVLRRTATELYAEAGVGRDATPLPDM